MFVKHYVVSRCFVSFCLLVHLPLYLKGDNPQTFTDRTTTTRVLHFKRSDLALFIRQLWGIIANSTHRLKQNVSDVVIPECICSSYSQRIYNKNDFFLLPFNTCVLTNSTQRFTVYLFTNLQTLHKGHEYRITSFFVFSSSEQCSPKTLTEHYWLSSGGT